MVAGNKKKGDIAHAVQERRRALGLTQEQAARKAEVPYNTLIKIESGAIKNPSVAIVSKIASALSLSMDSLLTPKTLVGSDALVRLWDDILTAMKVPGGFMCISGLDERQFLKADREGLKGFIAQLRERGISQKLLSREGDTKYLAGEHLEYRWIPAKYFSPTPIYVYADRVAILIWGDPIQIVILENELLADAYRKQFLFLWDRAKAAPRAKKAARIRARQ